jgi:hypothetical protein
VWLTGGSELPVPVGINNGCVCVFREGILVMKIILNL